MSSFISATLPGILNIPSVSSALLREKKCYFAFYLVLFLYYNFFMHYLFIFVIDGFFYVYSTKLLLLCILLVLNLFIICGIFVSLVKIIILKLLQLLNVVVFCVVVKVE